MNKRALLLTAATVALLSGPGYAGTCNSSTSTSTTCDITTEITSPLYTGAAPASGVASPQAGLGNIIIDTDGSLILGVNPPTAPAITINSNATVSNTTQIQYEGINDAVGILLEEASVPTAATGTGSTGNAENFTGEFFSTGTINLTGAGVGKNGILIAGGAFPGASTTDAGSGVYANTGLGVFTGSTGVEPAGGTTPVAIDLESGSIVEVQGTNSYGINLIGPTFTQTTVGGNTVNVPSGGASLIGDIDIAGQVEMTPVTLGDTTGQEQNIGVFIGGYLQSSANPTNPAFAGNPNPNIANCACAMVGNLNIEQGGSVTSEGQGAEGVVVQGAIQGAIVNGGTIATSGTTTPSTALNADDPEGSWALAVSNNVTGGIFNAGPTASGSGTEATRGTISMIGSTSTVIISPIANNIGTADTVPLPITIGGFTDASGFTYSLLNRGNITASSEDADLSNTGISIAGVSSSAAVTLTNGIFNSGAISSSVITNTDGSTTVTGATATAISIGNFVTVDPGNGGPSSTGPGGTPYALVNSNETGSGLISATLSGAETGTAVAIFVPGSNSGSTAGSLPSIYNSGTITASATTTNLLSTEIEAIAIEDKSGTLTQIFNSGTISATVTPLDDNLQSATAIDVSSNSTASVTISNEASSSSAATITGDIQFGSQPSTLNVIGLSNIDTASVTGNLYFRNTTSTPDQLNIGTDATVTGEISELNHASVSISIANTGELDLLTSQPTNVNSTVSVAATANVPLTVGNLNIAQGGNLTIALSEGNNVNAFPAQVVSVINAQNANIGGDGVTPTLKVSFGGFVGATTPNGNGSEFVLISVPQGGTFTISPQELGLLTNSLDSAVNTSTSTNTGIPFLFTSSICTFNVAGATGNQVCTGAEPYNNTNQEIVLSLVPKSPSLPVSQGGLGLTGNALKIFPFANEALINDNTLGAAMVTDITNSQQAQAAYASFVPDVSGATRATAISLTDSATNIVAARQRELNMYTAQEGDTTMWGQQFGERLSQNNSNNLTGYNDSGFGFVAGIDEGDPLDGRYGGAFTFFTGGMSEKDPVSAKTASEYYLLTGYTDWRGKGLFLDTQATIGYGNLKGTRYLNLTNAQTDVTTSRVADGDRPTELLAGSVTAGGIFTAGSTVFMPQFDVDGLTSREEGYTESNGGEGFDLQVAPYYAESLRAFLGADVRQDVNFGGFYLQPELRAGYRYDFVDGAVKLKANFASVDSQNGQAFNQFSITGPDPGHGNLVLGGGIATTTGTWSIGVSYDYVRAGSGPTEQTGVITLVGRI